MASRRGDKERLRAERLAAEAREQSQARRRLIAGYFVAGLLGVAVLAGLVVVLASGGGDGAAADAPENAHVQAQTGTFAGADLDGREGTPPPEIQFGDLEESAQRAGCTLRLNLPDEGNAHVKDSTPVQYKTVPPTSGSHNPTPLADGA
jgi:hypothetical protein